MSMWTLCARDLPALLSSAAGSSARITYLGKSKPASGSSGIAPQALDGALRAPRDVSSVKSCLFPSRQVVATYPREPQAEASETSQAKQVVVGLRACELRALAYLDRVFGNPPVSDPFYQQCRREHLLVAVDCLEPHETCFCNLLGEKPFAEGGFDINLTPIDNAYVAEAGSPAGEEMLARARQVLHEATPPELAAREAARRTALERLQEINAEYAAAAPLGPMSADLESSDAWTRLGETCVECGACTQICPTCHCFFMFDRAADGERFNRLRAWDSCVWSGYSRMAGAERMKPNPRSHFRSRFANRFLHKYVWSPQQWQMLGCVGCGRCVEACPGRISICKVIGEVSACSH